MKSHTWGGGRQGKNEQATTPRVLVLGTSGGQDYGWSLILSFCFSVFLKFSTMSTDCFYYQKPDVHKIKKANPDFSLPHFQSSVLPLHCLSFLLFCFSSSLPVSICPTTHLPLPKQPPLPSARGHPSAATQLITLPTIRGGASITVPNSQMGTVRLSEVK